MGRGEFRPTTGKELWGSKAADILLGADGENGKDWQKVNYVFIIKVKKAVLQRMDRRVVGRDCVSIIDKVRVTDARRRVLTSGQRARVSAASHACGLCVPSTVADECTGGGGGP